MDDFHRQWLTHKFTEIRDRTLKAIGQLDDEQLNWRPNAASNSISNLIRHIEGNIRERIMQGILKQDVHRDREAEFGETTMSKEVLIGMVSERFQLVIDTVGRMTDEELKETQQVRGKTRTHLDMLYQCVAHYSEHMGQIFYIAKLCLKDRYETTAV